MHLAAGEIKIVWIFQIWVESIINYLVKYIDIMCVVVLEKG